MKNWFENRGKFRITEMIFGLIHLLGFFFLPQLTYSLPSLGGLLDAAGAAAGIPRQITGFRLLMLQGISELESLSVFGYILILGALMGLVMILMHCFGKGKVSYAMTIVFGVLHHVIYIPIMILSGLAASASFGMFKLGIAAPILIAVSLAEFIIAIVGLVKDGKRETAGAGRSVHGKKEGMLICMEGSWKGGFFPIRDGETVLIGRDSEVCQIVLKGNNISRKHCAIRYNAAEGSYYVTDYSSNGVYDKNGRRLHKDNVDILHNEDEISFGRPLNVFRLGAVS